MSDKWTPLTKCPYNRFSNIVFISADEFVVAPYNYAKQKSDGILKYNTTTNKWMTMVKYPKEFQTWNCSLSFDSTERKLYLIGAQATVFVIDLKNKEISELPNGKIEVGVNPTSLFIDGQLHIIGGSRNRKHLMRDIYNEGDDEKAKDSFSEIYEFEDWAKGNQNCGLVYVQSKNQIILFGGYNQYNDHKYAQMVWVCNLNEKKNKKKWTKKVKMPERSCYFGYVLSADERYIVLIGGYTTDKKLVKKIYVLDVDQMKFIKTSNISSPASGSVRATMGEGAFIYLFKHDQGGLWKINIQSIISEYSSTDDNYAYQLVKKYKKMLKEHEMENRQLKLQLNKAKGGLKRQNSVKSPRSPTIVKNNNGKMKKQMNELEQTCAEQKKEINALKTRIKSLKKKQNNEDEDDDENSDKQRDNELKKIRKERDEFEEKCVMQENKIEKLDRKVKSLKQSYADLDTERMKYKHDIFMLKAQIKELKGDSENMDEIELMLKRQEEISKKQNAAMEAVGVKSPGT